MTSRALLAMYSKSMNVMGDIRGPAGRIACLPLVWKAATLMDPELLWTKALLTDCLERIDGDGFLTTAGKLVETLMENARFDATARHVCRSNIGRKIDAMSNCKRSPRNILLAIDVVKYRKLAFGIGEELPFKQSANHVRY
jgi:hypothetical protein